MATLRSRSRRSSLKKSRKFRDLARKQSRRLHLEQLEDRRLMAVFVLPNNGALLANGETRTVAPKDLTFRFTDIPGIDPTTINDGIRLIRAGQDGAFGQANDVAVPIGFVGLGDTNREVVMRFAESLPDDTYQITIVGAGATPLKDTAGNPFNAGVDVTINFRLDLGAQVVAVVPQPIRRVGNTLSMTEIVGGVQRSTENVIHVYFNNDDLDPVSAERREFYRLYVTKDTLDPADDLEILPTLVEYDAAANLARLTFGQVTSLDQFGVADGSRDPIKSFRLRIGTDEVRRNAGVPTETTRLGFQDPNSSFATAHDLGNAITTGSQGASRAFAQAIEPQFYSLVWPGSMGDPGDRDIPAESHLSNGNDLLNGADDGVDNDNLIRLIDIRGIPTVHYNFQSFLGSIPDGIGGSQPAFNLITENQKQRAREIFDLYTKYSGIQFVETEDSGLLVATGDLRVINPNIPTGPGGVAGLATADGAGGGIAVMDNAETWNDSYGGNWFQVAMHEIGHLLGLGHSYDLPQITIQGDDPTLQFNSPFAEPVFPGDHDIAHMRHMFRPDSKDIDMYRFVLDGAGLFTVETFAERLPDAAQIGVDFGTLSDQFRADSSALDTALRLYRQDPTTGEITEIARNDDYFSKDSLIQLDLEAGIYFVGVSASGNDQYDPSILDSGMGGTTQGPYEVKFDFKKTGSQTLVDAASPAGLIPDTLNVPLDGDADGVAGGVFNFWFRAAPLLPTPVGQPPRARTIFVDKRFTGASNGLLTAPYKNIDDAMAVAQEYDIVRIVGNGGADGNLATLQDNLAYQIGFDDFTQVLADGPELTVPKNVTVMIDA
ncbi:MAG: matrixin family metalloprotease, partial [Planctomycetaceae bacterium]|nr:matrixin family metalloprotease [Planctomycetaceae bacterium]